MSDKTTEEAASLRIGDLQSALIDANTTIAQLREETLNIISAGKELVAELESEIKDTVSEAEKLHFENVELREENERGQWVSVEDRLPMPNQQCVVWLNLSNAHASTAKYEWFDEIGYIFNSSYRTVITHWMPLPSPPTEALTPKE